MGVTLIEDVCLEIVGKYRKPGLSPWWAIEGELRTVHKTRVPMNDLQYTQPATRSISQVCSAYSLYICTYVFAYRVVNVLFGKFTTGIHSHKRALEAYMQLLCVTCAYMSLSVAPMRVLSKYAKLNLVVITYINLTGVFSHPIYPSLFCGKALNFNVNSVNLRKSTQLKVKTIPVWYLNGSVKNLAGRENYKK